MSLRCCSFASGALVAAGAGAAACVAIASGALAAAAVGAALPVLPAFRAGVAPRDAFAVEVFSGVAAAAGAIARRSNSVQRVLSGVITKCACGQMAEPVVTAVATGPPAAHATVNTLSSLPCTR